MIKSNKEKRTRTWRVVLDEKQFTIRFIFSYGPIKCPVTVFVNDMIADQDFGASGWVWAFSLSDGNKTHVAKITATGLNGFLDPSLEGVILDIDGHTLYNEAS